MFRNACLSLIAIAAFALAPLHARAQQPSGTNYGTFSAAFAAPALSGVGGATLSYSAGTVYNTAAQAITAGTLTSFTASENSCAAPAYSACEIIYWHTGTGLSASTSYATAAAAGNVLVGFVTTDSSSNVLTIVPATLAAPTGIAGSANGGTGFPNATSQTVATNGTQVNAGTCQAQTALTIAGVATTTAVGWSVATSLPATWQTGITPTFVVTANTVTPYLCNPTAGNITPVAVTLNVRVLQ